MSASVIERRRHRRVELPVTVSFRAVEQPSAAVPIVGHAKDVGLAGVYVVVPGSVPLSAGSAVFYTVEIPAEQQRDFPFSRLMGKGWVVRVQPDQLMEEGQSGVGVAIAFTDDATALSAAQPN